LSRRSKLRSDDEVGEVPFELGAVVVVMVPIGSVLDCAVTRSTYPLVRVCWFCQSMFDVLSADRLEGAAAEHNALGVQRHDVLGRPAIAGRLVEVRTVIGQHGRGASCLTVCNRQRPLRTAFLHLPLSIIYDFTGLCGDNRLSYCEIRDF